MNLIEQLVNTQQYGIKGGQMNLDRVREEILDHYRGKQEKEKQKKENEQIIMKLLYDMIKASGSAVINQAVNDLIKDFNKG